MMVPVPQDLVDMEVATTAEYYNKLHEKGFQLCTLGGIRDRAVASTNTMCTS